MLKELWRKIGKLAEQKRQYKRLYERNEKSALSAVHRFEKEMGGHYRIKGAVHV